MDPRSCIPRWLGSRAGVGFALCAALAAGAATQANVVSRAAACAAVAASIAIALAVLRFASSVGRRDEPAATKGSSLFELFAEDLCSAASVPEVVAAIEAAVRISVQCDNVELAVEPRLWVEGGERSSGAVSGAHLIASNRRPSEHVSLDLTFRRDKLGTLTASRRSGPFTRQETVALGAIVKHGALALAHTAMHCELESRREQQAAAWQDEREAVVETLSAEIVHEVRYPINFFRSIFQQASQTRVLDEEDIEIGREEVERLERLVFGLRRMTHQKLDRRMVDLAELCARAHALLRDRMSNCHLSLDLSGGGALECDPDKVTQVLVNLLANAVEATGGQGEIGIEWRPDRNGGVLEVWDSGPGFAGDSSRLFAPGHTTKARGTGLGLAITARLVRAHGWTIEASRSDSKTLFSVTVPDRDIAGRSGRHRVAAPVASLPSPQSSREDEGEVA
jgi:signal transduction histidine kinase